MNIILLLCIALVGGLSSISASPYFPSDYDQARGLFLAAVADIQMALPKKIKSKYFLVNGEEGEKLYTDFLFLDCRRGKSKVQPLLLLTSGVHGPESFVGSAAQIWFLKNQSQKRCVQGVSQVFIHALNPYGFKYMRRFNENNVDLNRNFPTSTEIYHQDNQAYKNLEEVLNPKKELNHLPLQSLTIIAKLAKRLVKGMSVGEIRQASVGGQYNFPKGIYYGGSAPEPVVVWLESILPEILNSHSDVLHYDFHTGLGEKGVLHMMVGPGLTSFGKKVIKKVIQPLAKGNFDLTTPSDSGFYKIQGDIIDFIPQLKKDGRILNLTAEYGTVGLGIFSQLKTLARLINENQGYHFGHSSDRVKRTVKQRLRDIFHPPKKQWLDQVREKNSYILTKVLDDFLAILN